MKLYNSQLIVLPLSLVLALAVTACGGSSETPTIDSPSASETLTAVQSDETNTSAVITTMTSESSSSEDGASVGAETSGANPPPKGQELTLDDFGDKTEGWQDSSYDVADRSGITGIGVTLSGSSICGTPENADLSRRVYGISGLRLNLSHKYNTLKFKIGQSNSSVAVDQRVLVRITDGKRQIGDIHPVDFDEIEEVEADVSGMNALFLQFYLDDKVKTCGSQEVTPVIYDVIVD